ncbi:MAG: ribonuclease P protein component [Xenococcus sp. MO_188.B8]|nr:ribonuclease P protein component [Xenococcus sp. MO_188.B8]
MGLPQIHRLKHWRDFRTVYQQGIRRHSEHLVLRAWFPRAVGEQSQINPSRIGISIGKKVSKKAVVRNRIKRQIHGAFLQLLPRILDGWQIVVVVKPTAVECKYDDFLRELEELLKKTKIINGY